MPRLLRRIGRLILWTSGAFAVLLALLVVLLGWRLSQGPLRINVLLPYIEAALANPKTGHRADIQDLVLSWDMQAHHIDLHARHAAILDVSGDTVAQFPTVELALRLSALWRGKIALYRVGIEGARVNLVRSKDGRFGLRGEMADRATSDDLTHVDLARFLSTLIDAFDSEPDLARPLSYLHEMRVERGTLSVQDDVLGTTWEAPRAELAIQRQSEGIAGEVHVEFALPSGLARLDAEAFYHGARDRINTEIAFADIRLSAFARPGASPVAHIDVPFSGSLALSLDARGRLHDLHFDVSSPGGQLTLPTLPPTMQAVAGVVTRGHVDRQHGTFSLQNTTVRFGTDKNPGPVFHLSGKAQGLAPHLGDGATTARLHGSMMLAEAHTDFTAEAVYSPDTARTAIKTSFSNLRPAAVAALLPDGRHAAGLDLPVDGAVELTVGAQRQLQTLHFDLNGKAGTLSMPPWLPTSHPVAHIAATGDWEGSTRTLQLARASIRFGTAQSPGPTITASGVAEDVTGDMKARVQATLTALPMAELKRYWPPAFRPKTRTWLSEHIVAGMLTEGQVHIALGLSETPGAVRLERLDGTLRYDDLTVHYLRPLPPVVGVKGTGRFSRQAFDLDVEGGHIAGLKAASGNVKITGLDRQRDAIAIQETLEGPVQEALNLLHHPRLNLLAKFAIDPARVDGRMKAELGFRFPLRGKLTMDKVDFDVRANLDDIAMRDLVRQYDVSGGKADLRVNPQGMTLQGSAAFAAIPLTFDWNESFSPQSAWRRQVRVHAPQIATAAIADLGFHLDDVVKGTFAASAEASFAWDQTGAVKSEIDLRHSELNVPLFRWHKAAGERATAAAVLHLRHNQPTALRHLVIKGTRLALQGQAEFDPQQPDRANLELRDIRIGESRLRQVSIQRQGHHVDIRVGEGVLDIRPFDTPNPDHTPGPRGETDIHPPITFYFNAPALRQVRFGPERYLEDVLVTLVRGRAGWERLHLAGHIPLSLARSPAGDPAETPTAPSPRRKAFFLNYDAFAAHQDGLFGQIEDLGAFLRALNIAADLEGGHLTLSGQTVQPAPGRPIVARLDMENFTVYKAPQLARLVAALPSPTGLQNLMQSDGLVFDQLASELSLHQKVVRLAWLRTYGGALGLTAEGAIDLGARQFNLEGTVIPVRNLNALLGWVPGLNVLVGGKGQGLFAMNYRLAGPLAAPEVTVNPVSLITPGVLRKLFDIFAPQEQGANRTP